MEQAKEKGDLPIITEKGLPSPITTDKGLSSNLGYGYYNYSQNYHHDYPPVMAYPVSYPPYGYPPQSHGYPPQGYPPQGYPSHGYSSSYGHKMNMSGMLPMLAGGMAASYGVHHMTHGSHYLGHIGGRYGHGYHHGKMKFGKHAWGYGHHGYHGKFRKWK